MNINYTGIGPIFSEIPGKVEYISGGATINKSELNLGSAFEWEPNPFSRRLDGTTNTQLGTNMYAEDRKPLKKPSKPPVPSETLAPSKPKPEIRSTAEDTAAMANEYNSLADLICTPNEDNESYKLNLFPEIMMKGDGTSTKIDANVIDITLGSDTGKLKDMVDKFGDLGVAKPEDVEKDDDDLLAMMD